MAGAELPAICLALIALRRIACDLGLLDREPQNLEADLAAIVRYGYTGDPLRKILIADVRSREGRYCKGCHPLITPA